MIPARCWNIGEGLGGSCFRELLKSKSIAGSPGVSPGLKSQRLVSIRKLHRAVRAEVGVKKINFPVS